MMKQQRGFSLVEAMVAIVIITIGFVGIYALTGNSEVYNQRSAERDAAASIAVQIVDVIAAGRPFGVVDTIAAAPYNGTVNLNLNNCQYGNPTPGSLRAQGRPSDSADFEVFFIQWCNRLNDRLGAMPAAVRTISVIEDISTPDGNRVDLVTLTLQDNGINISLTEAFLL